jgi:DNA repair exonuclease SbcCD nuclease subunit
MKLALASDLHLEFGHIELENPGVDVLILSGDICVASKFGPDYDRFFNDVSKAFKHVVYIVGNHEHYNGDFNKTIDTLRMILARYENVHLLDKETFVLDDVTFIGGTLWTDMNKEDVTTLITMPSVMNDFRCVTNSNRKVSHKVPIYKKDAEGNFVYKNMDNMSVTVIDHYEHREQVAKFSPEDSVEDHKKMVEYIRSVTEGKFDQKFVVVGHHAPSKLSTHPKYAREVIMNGAYSSDLSEFILDHPQIKLWTHGHTHEEFDYILGETRIVCNPRGYINYEKRADDFKLKVLEI